MKKSLLALAALTAFAGAASAQSSVTLFGIVDLAVTSVDNSSGGTVKSLAQDGINSSRLGFRGACRAKPFRQIFFDPLAVPGAGIELTHQARGPCPQSSRHLLPVRLGQLPHRPIEFEFFDRS